MKANITTKRANKKIYLVLKGGIPLNEDQKNLLNKRFGDKNEIIAISAEDGILNKKDTKKLFERAGKNPIVSTIFPALIEFAPDNFFAFFEDDNKWRLNGKGCE